MTMLTPTQRAALSSALEGAETGDGDATQALFRVLSDVLPFHTLNVLTAARWLLRVDDAHTQSVRAAYNRAIDDALACVQYDGREPDAEAVTETTYTTIAALRQAPDV
jgi:hypothetical protein